MFLNRYFVIGVLVIGSPIWADSPENAVSLSDLVKQYEAHGLPMPADHSKLMRFARHTGSSNGVPRYDRWIAFVEVEEGGKQKVWEALRKRPYPSQSKLSEAPTDASAIDDTETAEHHVYVNGFSTSTDLALAIQCAARGYHDLANKLLERARDTKRRRPSEPIKKRYPNDKVALADLAWSYWCNEFSRGESDRHVIIDRLDRMTKVFPSLETPANLLILTDMRLTVEPANSEVDSMEAVIDGLLDLGTGGGWRGLGFGSLSDCDNDKRTSRLRKMGLSAVPVLLKHTHDFRMTRCMSTESRGVYQVRIADVVRHLLNGLVDEEFAYDCLIEQGRGNVVDRDHVLHWWGIVSGNDAKQYLIETAIKFDRRGNGTVNSNALSALGDQYPGDLLKLIEANLSKLDFPRPLFVALAESKIDDAFIDRTLLQSAEHESARMRAEAVSVLLDREHVKAEALLGKQFDLLPVTPDEPYWTAPTGFIAGLVHETDSNSVWNALYRNTRRVDVGQRLEILDAVASGCRKQTASKAKVFLAAFLDDRDLRIIEDPDPFAASNAESGSGKLSKQYLFSGPSAGFIFPRLAVGDYAAMLLADLLGIDETPDLTWSSKQWEDLGQRVKTKMKKQSGHKSDRLIDKETKR
ncbi:MAG: hypothetical protein AAF664_12570 [Planctomycetota bacterium]